MANKKDCNKTKDFFEAMNRACALARDNCTGCPFENVTSAPYNAYSCQDFILTHTAEAIKMLQKFEDEHPRITLLNRFKKEHPNAPLWNGVPGCDPIVLGYLPETMREFVDSLGEKIWLIPIEDIDKSSTVINKKKEAEKKNVPTLLINGKEVPISDEDMDIINDVLSPKKTSTQSINDLSADIINALSYLLW